MTNRPLEIAIAGLGNRGLDSYAKGAHLFPDKMKIVAVADLDPRKVEKAAREYGIPPERCFSSAEEMLEQDKLADAMFIMTHDRQHVGQALPAIRKGYDLLLEKPISPVLEECRELERVAHEYGRHVVICHVLRYTPFYRRLKDLLDAGVIGEIIHVSACEDVGYYHMAHSFVRGNWNNDQTTSPIMLQKCCHDMDLYLWLTGKQCKNVSSFGSLRYFRPENAPEGSAARCVDCGAPKQSCVFDAEKIYLTNRLTGIERGNTEWPCNVLCVYPTVENVHKALEEGPYGRCVFRCDNNVVDHQVVNLRMTDDSTLSFTLCGFANFRSERSAKFMGTLGKIVADLTTSTISVHRFGEDEPEVIRIDVDDYLGHGGGDEGLLRDFCSLLLEGKQNSGITSVEQSLQSHYIALAADQSRKANGLVIDLDEFKNGKEDQA